MSPVSTGIEVGKHPRYFRVRFPTGRFVHYSQHRPPVGWGYPTVCHQVMEFHRDRAMLTDEPATCAGCLRYAR